MLSKEQRWLVKANTWGVGILWGGLLLAASLALGLSLKEWLGVIVFFLVSLAWVSGSVEIDLRFDALWTRLGEIEDRLKSLEEEMSEQARALLDPIAKMDSRLQETLREVYQVKKVVLSGRPDDQAER
jgi:hypothetical protein